MYTYSQHRRGPGGAAGTVFAGRAEAAGARNIPPLLELLVNISRADPHAVTVWLTNGVYCDWSPGSALAGLEAELNNRDEKVGRSDAGTAVLPSVYPLGGPVLLQSRQQCTAVHSSAQQQQQARPRTVQETVRISVGVCFHVFKRGRVFNWCLCDVNVPSAVSLRGLP